MNCVERALETGCGDDRDPSRRGSASPPRDRCRGSACGVSFVVVCQRDVVDVHRRARSASAVAAIASRHAGRYRVVEERRAASGTPARRAACTPPSPRASKRRAVGFRHRRRKRLERGEQRAGQRIAATICASTWLGTSRNVICGGVSPLREPLLHQRDGLVDQGGHAARAGTISSIVVVAIGGRHDRDGARDVLLQALQLVHRHQQVVRDDAAKRHARRCGTRAPRSPSPRARDRGRSRAVQPPRAPSRSIAARRCADSPQMCRSRLDGRRRIVGPSVVLSRKADAESRAPDTASTSTATPRRAARATAKHVGRSEAWQLRERKSRAEEEAPGKIVAACRRKVSSYHARARRIQATSMRDPSLGPLS